MKPRFRLSTLLLLIAMASIVLGWDMQVRRRVAEVNQIRCAWVFFASDYSEEGCYIERGRSPFFPSDGLYPRRGSGRKLQLSGWPSVLHFSTIDRAAIDPLFLGYVVPNESRYGGLAASKQECIDELQLLPTFPLRSLYLRGKWVSDAIPILSKMRTLRWLDIEDVELSHEQLKLLMKKLPSTTIVHSSKMICNYDMKSNVLYDHPWAPPSKRRKQPGGETAIRFLPYYSADNAHLISVDDGNVVKYDWHGNLVK